MRIVVAAGLLLAVTAAPVRGTMSCAPGPYVIFFEAGSSVLRREQVDILDTVIENAGYCGSVSHLDGHADTAENPGIVRDRLRAVAGDLAARGLFVKRRNMVDRGATRPRIETGARVSERQNRRVEITFASW